MKRKLSSTVSAVRCLTARLLKRLYPSLMVLLFMLGAGKSLNTVHAQCETFIVTLMQVDASFTYINFCVSSADQQTTGNWSISYAGTPFPDILGTSEACVTATNLTNPSIFTVTFDVNGVSCTETFQLGDGGCPDEGIITTNVGSCGAADITVNLDPFDINLPYVIHFGDGTTQFVDDEDFEFTHNYPCYGGVFDVCLTYSYEGTNNYRTCCGPIVIPNCGCCHTAGFVIQEVLPTPSCLNRIFEITPLCADGGNNTHKWEFEDGTVIYGPTVPQHHFTNFVNFDGNVWVKHTVTCCGTTLTETKTISFSPGAYLGWPGGDLKFSYVFPAAAWNGNTTINVVKFLTDYSKNPAVPLFIDGKLTGDINAAFTGGGWNMGRNSSIEIQGSQSVTRLFTLNSVTIQSPVRLSPFYGGCCRWKGIKSSGRTKLKFLGAQVFDAEIMLEYQPVDPNAPASFIQPEIEFVSNFFENNQTLIKSDGIYFNVTKFEENSIIGRLDPLICDCIANNAFDLRNIGGKITFPYTISNDVQSYEQGFHLENTRLDVKGFYLHDLENCMGTNPDNDDGIGISFAWTNATKSDLTLDFLEFENMATSVRERVSAGKHTLKANASVPFSFGSASIKMAEVGKGYDVVLTSTSPANISIKGNDIATNGAIENFGVRVNVTSQDNTVLAEGNKVVCGNNSPATRGIEVINTAGTLGTSQNVKVLYNLVDAEGTGATGAGIIVSKANGARVANNTVEVANDFNGIEVGNSNLATISCNNISEAKDGIVVNTNVDMIVDANTISISSENSLDVNGLNNGTKGSSILWNVFGFSTNEEVFYAPGAVTGKQWHKNYNSWVAPLLGAFELRHAEPGLAIQSQFWRPSNASQGSIHFPKPDPTNFIKAAPDNTILTRPVNYCAADITPNIEEPDPEETAARHAEFITELTGTNSNDGAHAALLQGEYGFLLDNPGWMTFEPALDSFYNAQSPGFVGQSVQVQHQMLALQQTMFAQHNSRQPLNTVRDSLLGVLDWIADQAEQTTDPTVLASLEIQANTIRSQIEVIEFSLSAMLASDEAANAVEMVNLQSINALLPDTAIYMANERKVNELTIKHWAGQSLTGLEAETLREIAQTCYELTGRSGFMARTLCLVALGEYYREPACPTAEPRAKATLSSTDRSLYITPNPVSGLLILTLDSSWSNESFSISIFDATGREVLFSAKEKDESSVIRLDVSKLISGSFYLTASNAEKSKTISFVVQQ